MKMRLSKIPFRLASTAAVIALTAAPGVALAAVGIQGALSNFDVFNDTAANATGAELELVGVHSSDVTSTFPSHFNHIVKTDYTSGTLFGTRIDYTAYNFNASGFIAPTPGQSTNGHFCVNIPGCEHFGFAVSVQPTDTRYFWLDQTSNRIGTTPMSVPSATWNYVPAVQNQPARLQAQIAVPQPEIPEAMLPDSLWVKTYITESDVPVELNDLLSGNALINNAQVETEWSLLEGGVPDTADAAVGANAEAVIRRYEYYKYTGPYDPTDHSPLSAFTGGNLTEPPAGELGAFISANMVAANLAAPIPEPRTYALLLAGLCVLVFASRRRLNAVATAG
jgi:hypothetical protein